MDQDLPQPCKALGMWGNRVTPRHWGTEFGSRNALHPWGLKQRGSISSTLEDSQKARASLDWAGSPLLLSVFSYSQLPGVTKLCFPGASVQIRTPSPLGARALPLGVSWRHPFPYDNAGKRNGPRSLPLDQIHRSCYTQHSFAIW